MLSAKNIGKSILKYVLLFCGAILIYVLAVTAVWLIPGDAIEANRSAAVDYIENTEGLYPSFFYGERNSALDNYSDRSMMRHVVPAKKYNALENAMWGKKYARYWHGYQVFLRPLLISSSYQQIRLITTACFFILIFSCFYMLCKRTSFLCGMMFVISMISVKCLVIPVSLQYSNMFLLMLAVFLIALLFYKQKRDWSVFFFLVGSVTNFFDYLTTPLITLGIPLIVILLLDAAVTKPIKQLSNVIRYSALWTVAYGVTWFTKWVLASLILKKDIIKDAMETIFFRVNGNEEHTVSRISAVKENIEVFVSGRMLLIFVVIILLLVICVIRAHKDWSVCISAVPVLFIGLYPYIWYVVLANHSQIHSLFTYRNQLLTVFAVLGFLVHCIDFSKFEFGSAKERISMVK